MIHLHVDNETPMNEVVWNGAAKHKQLTHRQVLSNIELLLSGWYLLRLCTSKFWCNVPISWLPHPLTKVADISLRLETNNKLNGCHEGSFYENIIFYFFKYDNVSRHSHNNHAKR